MDELLRTDVADTIASDPRDKDVGEMLLALLRSLVDKEEELEMVSLADAGGVSFQVHSAPDDIGKLIGKGGRTARAIRVILGANGVKHRRRYSIDFGRRPA